MTGWRLSAEELEARVEGIVRDLLSDATLAGRLMIAPGADEIAQLQSALLGTKADANKADLLDLARRIDVAPGLLALSLDDAALAALLEIDPDRLAPDVLTRSVPFQLRKRGVGTKLVLADTPTGRDDTLIRNIARAHRWFNEIKSGRSFDEIADVESTSKRRVQQMINLAFLAPDIICGVLDDKHAFARRQCREGTTPGAAALCRTIGLG